MKLFFTKINKSSKGFTLVETLVALSIFSVSILAVMSVLASSISDTNYAKQKAIGTYLAQEGLEYIRNMRDTYMLYGGVSPTGWDAFRANLTDASDCNETNGCYLNADGLDYEDASQPMIDIQLTACSSSNCTDHPMSYDEDTGKYGFTETASGFSRQIKVDIINDDETKITSTVYWGQGSGIHSVTFSENLFSL